MSKGNVSEKYAIVADWETSGIRDTDESHQTFLSGPQGIELGAILVTLPDFNPIEEYSAKIKFLGTHNGTSYGGPLYERLTWSESAEQIHGLSIEHLHSVGKSPTLVAEEFINMLEHRDIRIKNTRILFCGHNPQGDIYYLKQLLFFAGFAKKVRFHNRLLDTFSLGYMLYGDKNSNELFLRTSNKIRTTHVALEDARLTLTALQYIKKDLRNFVTPT